MSTPEDTQGEQANELGFTARTDVGGNTGTQPDATSTETATVPGDAPADLALPSDVGNTTIAAKPDATPGEPLGNDAPTLESLQHKPCPNCSTGVLYVTNYDPHAEYEADQGEALLKGHESGGAYEVECRHCGYTDSRALNPGKNWGR